MKALKFLPVLFLVGCAVQNPAWTPGNTNGVPKYLPDPKIEAVSNAAFAAAQAAAPVNPYAVWTDWAIRLGFGIAGAAGGFAAAKKKKG